MFWNNDRNMTKVAPSILSADFAHLADEIKHVTETGILPNSLNKIKRLRQIIKDNDYNCLIEVDGGITIETAPSVRQAGANILVAGTAIYESSDVWASAAMLLGE